MSKFQGMWQKQFETPVGAKPAWGEKDYRGLKAHRGERGRVPAHKCGNCGCARYVPCKCTKKGE